MLLNQLLALCLTLGTTAVHGAQSTKAKATNSKQAAGLQAAAVFLKPAKGGYIFTNVGTGEKIHYEPNGNHIYPCKKQKPTAIAVHTHSNKKLPWHQLRFGTKNKCYSSAWGGRQSGNNAAVAYVCASGAEAKKTTLERTKQWWLLVPVSKPIAAAAPNSYANGLLLAAQGDSIATRNKKIAAQQSAFDRRRHVLTKRALLRRAKSASTGTYYLIPTDHLMDMPARALTGKAVTSRGIKSTALSVWKNGNQNQQWRVTLA